MNERSKAGRLSPPVQIALVACGLLVLAVGGYMLLVKPKRAEAAKVEAQVAAVQKQIADLRSASEARQISVAVKAADLFRLAKAIPADTSMASIILELNRVASDAGILFDSITPQAPVADTGYHTQPITLSFRGNFFTLTDFLFRLRQLVQVHDGRLGVTGRLFAVKSITFSEDDDRKFPFVTANLDVNAFVFGNLPGAPTAATAAPGTSTASTDTSTSTTQTTSTQPAAAPSGASAAPATPSP
jgi:hypothetical protein